MDFNGAGSQRWRQQRHSSQIAKLRWNRRHQAQLKFCAGCPPDTTLPIYSGCLGSWDHHTVVPACSPWLQTIRNIWFGMENKPSFFESSWELHAWAAVCCMGVKLGQRKENEVALHWAEMIRWMRGGRLTDKLSCVALRQKSGIEDIATVVQHRLRWYG